MVIWYGGFIDSIYRNGSSLPPRLPGLSQVLRGLNSASEKNDDDDDDTRYTIVALSYRGFWTSSGRPSEHGIMLDAEAALAWIAATFPSASAVVPWGQSLGAGVAVAAAAAHGGRNASGRSLQIRGLILETPFTSVKDMLAAIYPQPWLPYRYLWPFLRSRWDSRRALGDMVDQRTRPEVLILQAGNDELVPATHAEELETLSKNSRMDVRRLVINGALHHEVMFKPHGKAAVIDFLRNFGVQK